jgi:hypothetical protein
MLDPRLRRLGLSFCLAAALSSSICVVGSADKAEVIWFLLLFFPLIAVFGEWQYRLGQNEHQR